VPQRAATAQPDAELAVPEYSRRHQVSDHDRVIGTHRLVLREWHDSYGSTVIAA
jgi:hypothetical protein